MNVKEKNAPIDQQINGRLKTSCDHYGNLYEKINREDFEICDQVALFTESLNYEISEYDDEYIPENKAAIEIYIQTMMLHFMLKKFHPADAILLITFAYKIKLLRKSQIDTLINIIGKEKNNV